MVFSKLSFLCHFVICLQPAWVQLLNPSFFLPHHQMFALHTVTITHVLIWVALSHGIPNPHFWWSMGNFQGCILKFNHPSTLFNPRLPHTVRRQLQVPVHVYASTSYGSSCSPLYSLLQAYARGRMPYVGSSSLLSQLSSSSFTFMSTCNTFITALLHLCIY